MKRSLICVFMLGLFAVSAFGDKNSDKVKLTAPVTLGAAQLSPGDYKVTWTGTGENVQVTLERGGKSPVTAQAKLVEEKSDEHFVTIGKKGEVRVLQAIQLGRISLVFQNSQPDAK